MSSVKLSIYLRYGPKMLSNGYTGHKLKSLMLQLDGWAKLSVYGGQR